MNELVYRNNIEELRNQNIVITEEQKNSDLKVDVINSKKDNTLIVKVTDSNKEIYFNSKYNPEKQVEEWFSELENIKYSSTFLLIGFGSGLYLKKLVSETPDTVNIIVYEPCLTIFLKVIEEIDIRWALSDKRITFIIEEINGKKIKDILSYFIYSANINLFRIDIHSGYDKLFNEKIVSTLEKVKDFLECIRISENTQILFSNVTAKNLLYGASKIPFNYSIDQLIGHIPTDRPAIIVGAGPSLKKNIKELKKVKGRAFIIAVDTALKPLLKENIIPDIYVIVDAIKPINLFDDERISNIPIVYGCTANSDILTNHKDKIFYFNTDAYSNQLFSIANIKCSILDTGGSVSNSAFSLALLIGFKTIILVGQDLAYTGNRSHVEGSFSEEEIASKTITGASAMVEDIHGNMVPTQLNMLKFIKWFEEKIDEYDEEIKVYDSTEGGAKIQGTEIMDLHLSIDKCCPNDVVDFQKIITEIPCLFNESDINECKKFFTETIDSLKKGKRMIKDGIGHYTKLLKMFKNNDIDRNKMIKIQKKVEKINSFVNKDPVMQMVIQSISDVNFALLNGIYDVEEDIQDEGVAIADRGITMLSHMDKEIDKIIPLAKEVFEYE